MTPFGTVSTASKTVSFPRPAKRRTMEPFTKGKKLTLKNPIEADAISFGEIMPFVTSLQSSVSERFVFICLVCSVFTGFVHFSIYDSNPFCVDCSCQF